MFDALWTLQVSSSVQHDFMTLQSSHMVGPAGAVQTLNSNSDQLLLSLNGNRNVSLYFPSGNVCPNISLSLSNLTGESSAADYQDCGVSPVFLTGESPWDSNLETGRPQARNEAKMRYNEKKKSRLYVVSLYISWLANFFVTPSMSCIVIMMVFPFFGS